MANSSRLMTWTSWVLWQERCLAVGDDSCCSLNGPASLFRRRPSRGDACFEVLTYAQDHLAATTSQGPKTALAASEQPAKPVSGSYGRTITAFCCSFLSHHRIVKTRLCGLKEKSSTCSDGLSYLAQFSSRLPKYTAAGKSPEGVKSLFPELSLGVTNGPNHS